MTPTFRVAAGGVIEAVRRLIDPREPPRSTRRSALPVDHRRRILWVLGGVVVAYVFLASRLAELQVVNAADFQAF